MVSQAHERHTVQAYETDGFLVQRIVEFIGAGLRAGDRCVVVATRLHRDALQAELTSAGFDVGDLLADGDLTMLDANDTLAGFMIGGSPDPLRFELTVGSTIARATRDGRHVRAFGEMVDLLWRDNQPEAALQLERLWNELARKYDFDLLCAYTMANLYKTSSTRFRDVCEMHDHVHPFEAKEPAEPTTESARLLVAEIARRAAVERELRDTIRALQRAEDLERVRATRAAKLQQATAALASVVSIGELADTIISTSRHLTGALSAGAYIADNDGRFRIAGQMNVQQPLARLHVMPLDDARPIARALATGQPQWLEKREQLFEQYPKLIDAGVVDPRTHAVIALPFVNRGKVIGGLGLAFETQRMFSEEERAWLLAYAAQCALAIERVHHYTTEQKARIDAENLLRIAESLNAAHLDLEAVLQKVTDEATALVGAQYGAFAYSALTTVSDKEAPGKLGLPRAIPKVPQRSDEPSRLAVPVRSRSGDVIGALFLGHDEPLKFTAQHEAVLRSLAVTAAIAIDNAELYQAAREAEDAQRRSVEQLVDTVRMNELFTGVLAHDLRSPIAAVTTATELLMQKAGDYEKKVLTRVLRSATRMARMIEQLLDFTRIRVGSGLPLDSRPCDLNAIVTHVVDELRIAHAKQPIDLAIAGDTKGQWDDDRLAQALQNLIGNAAQHGTSGVSVHVDGTDASVVRVRIHNAGSIPEALLPRIFEPMIGGQQRRDGTRGLGLGLFITREIAASHGGIVSVESTEEAGTTFTLCLPRHVASIEPIRREPQPAATPEPAFDIGQRARVLVDGAREHAIFLLDEHGSVLTWNQTAERITGCSRSDAMNRPFELDLTRATKLGFSEQETWRHRRDGTAYWAEVSASAIRSPSGDLVGFTIVLRDVTELREARKKLEENEARLRLMIDSVRDYAIFLLDPQGNVATWNRGAQLAKGYTPGEIIGRNISTFYTRADREAGRPEMLLARAVEEGRVEDEGWRVRKDGSRFWADVVITALRDEHGQLRGFTKVTRDLTDRRRAEDELRRSEERFRLLVDSVKDYAIFMLDPTGHVMTWNAGAERFKGYKAHEIVGDHFSRFYDPEEVRAGKCERELEIAVREGRFEEEGWRIRKDGTRFWANVIITTLRAANGEVMGFVKVTRDLTERKTLEEQRLRTIQAQEGIRLRDEFLSIVSHELKTPLAGLLLQIDAIGLRGLDEGTRVKLARARESGVRLDRLIEMLLDVSRIATGRFVLGLEDFDMTELLRSTVDSFVPAASKANCELQLRVPDQLVGRWDRVRMTQVLANLLANAMKYGAGAPIEIRAERIGDDLALEVRDHGPGVDPTVQSRIFDRFERAMSTWHYGGLGLGLYVVREIVTAHGGKVAVENASDGGARFTVRLPMETTA